MHIVIGGAGHVGVKLAEFLLKEDHDVILIDSAGEARDRLSGMDCAFIFGSAAAGATLEAAEIRKADVFYAVTSHDEINLAAAAIAHTHGAKRVIARVNSHELMTEAESREFRPIGVDVAVSPDLVAATKIVRLIEFPGVLEMSALKVGKLRIVEARVEVGSATVGQAIEHVELPRGVNLVAIFRGAEVVIPRGADVLHAGDHVVLLLEQPGLMADATEAFGSQTSLHKNVGPPKHVVVVGATSISRRVAKLLRRGGRRVTVVTESHSHAQIEHLASELEGILVLQGSFRDVRFVREEGLDEADVVIATTAHEEFNLITCLLARSLGVARTAAVVDQPELEDLAERLGVDVAVSPRLAAVATMLKYASDLEPEELTLLHHGEAQVLVVEVEKGNKIAGKRLKDADMPRGAVVGALVRGRDAIVPRGDERVEPGDSLVIFAKSAAVPGLSQLF